MPVREYAKEIPLGQKAKPGRKKKTTKALLYQADDHLPGVADEEIEEEEQQQRNFFLVTLNKV